MYQEIGTIPNFKWIMYTQMLGCRLVYFFQIDSQSVMYIIGSVLPKYFLITFVIICGVMKHKNIWYITLSHDVRFGIYVPHHLLVIYIRVFWSAFILSSSLGKVPIVAFENSWRVIVSMVSLNFGSFFQHIYFEIQHTQYPNVVQHSLFKWNSWFLAFHIMQWSQNWTLRNKYGNLVDHQPWD